MVGSVAFVVIGALHTFVHVSELSGAQLEARFELVGTVAVGQDRAEAWDLFQGISLLMGAFSMALGGTNLAALLAGPADALPPAGICASSVAMLACIGVVGFIYLGPLQAVGGPVGMLLFGLPIAARWIHGPRPRVPAGST